MVKKPPGALSRRALIGAASAAPALTLIVPPGGRPDRLVARCAEWLAIDFESDRLSVRWAALERRLVDEYRWLTLSSAERHGLPQAAEMFDIEARLDRLADEGEHRLKALAGLDAKDLHGVAGKLAVASRVLRHEGGPAHELVADAVQVLAIQCCPRCGRPYLSARDEPMGHVSGAHG